MSQNISLGITMTDLIIIFVILYIIKLRILSVYFGSCFVLIFIRLYITSDADDRITTHVLQRIDSDIYLVSNDQYADENATSVHMSMKYTGQPSITTQYPHHIVLLSNNIAVYSSSVHAIRHVFKNL